MSQRLYVIWARGSGWVKIGKSADPQVRLRQLQTGSPHELVLLDIEGIDLGWPGETEEEWHDSMGEYRGRGEWFLLAGDLLDTLWTAIADATGQAQAANERPQPLFWGTDETCPDEAVARMFNPSRGFLEQPRHTF